MPNNLPFPLRSLLPLLGGLLLLTCTRSDERRLFEMAYPNIRFAIPAGLPGGFVPQAFVNVMNSNYDNFLDIHNVESARIGAIRPAIARLNALENVDFADFVNRISVRICPEEIPECRQVEEVFYLEYDDILRQSGDQLQLLPTLINAKRLLEPESFKLEVWFTFLTTTPRRVDTQLDMVFDAVE